jgi:hypothetical protein
MLRDVILFKYTKYYYATVGIDGILFYTRMCGQ